MNKSHMKNIIPRIKRTRGFFLYDTKGRRYLDLYLDNGRALLGHRLDGISRVIKSTAARGLTAPYPSVYDGRVEKQLRLLYPEAAGFRLFRNSERALAAVSASVGESLSIEDFLDFPDKTCRFALRRPFIGFAGSDWFIPLLPFPGDFGPVAVGFSGNSASFADSDAVSPFIADMLVKSVVMLRNTVIESDYEEWDRFDSVIWNRTGPYLRFSLNGDEYSSLFKTALECGVLLPPDPGIPGIIPAVYTEGSTREFFRRIGSEYGV